MDIDDKIEELMILVEDAKAMPLSASCIVNRGQVLDMLDDIRTSLPASIDEAKQVLAARSAVVAEGRAEADAAVAAAREEQARLVSQHEVYLAAVAEADALRRQTEAEIGRMQAESDDYIDSKLANFEVILDQTLGVVQRGRDSLRERSTTYHALADDTQD